MALKHVPAVGRLLRIIPLLSLGLSGWVVNAAETPLAADVYLRNRIDPWGLYCVKGVVKPQYNDCSLATAMSSAEDPRSLWAKIAISVASVLGDLYITIETPRLRYIRGGVSLAVAGEQTSQL